MFMMALRSTALRLCLMVRGVNPFDGMRDNWLRIHLCDCYSFRYAITIQTLFKNQNKPAKRGLVLVQGINSQ